MWWFFFVFFLVISIFSSTLLVYALKRITQYENYLSRIQSIIEVSTEKMKAVDATGHYEADDETGFFFDEIKKIQKILDNLFEIEEIENAEKK